MTQAQDLARLQNPNAGVDPWDQGINPAAGAPGFFNIPGSSNITNNPWNIAGKTFDSSGQIGANYTPVDSEHAGIAANKGIGLTNIGGNQYLNSQDPNFQSVYPTYADDPFSKALGVAMKTIIGGAMTGGIGAGIGGAMGGGGFGGMFGGGEGAGSVTMSGAGGGGGGLFDSISNMFSGAPTAGGSPIDSAFTGFGDAGGSFGGGAGDLWSQATNGLIPNTSLGGAASSMMGGVGALSGGGGAAGGGMFDSLINGIKSAFAPTQGGGSIGMNTNMIIPSLLNYLIKNNQAQGQTDAANAGANRADALMQPQRLPFQQQFQNLMTNPSGYQQTPYAQGQMNQLQQAFDNNVSKYGPSGTQFVNGYLKPAQNIMSQDFFNLANTLSTAGGYNQGPGYSGNILAQGLGNAANTQATGQAGFGSIFNPNTDMTKAFGAQGGDSDIFAKFAQAMSGTNSYKF